MSSKLSPYLKSPLIPQWGFSLFAKASLNGRKEEGTVRGCELLAMWVSFHTASPTVYPQIVLWQWLTARCASALNTLRHQIRSVNFESLRLWWVSVVFFSAAIFSPILLHMCCWKSYTKGSLLLVIVANSDSPQWLQRHGIVATQRHTISHMELPFFFFPF